MKSRAAMATWVNALRRSSPALVLALALGGGAGLPRAALAGASHPAVEIDLHDPSGRAMAPLHRALQRAARGEGQARLLFYGASHVASDTFTGRLRQHLQRRFGDAGHGFVLPAPPWRGYRHQDVNIDGTLTWWGDWIGKGGARDDGLYGLAGVSLSSGSPDDYASVFTTVDNEQGRNVSRFELYYLEQPRGGTLSVRVDGREVEPLRTAGPVERAAYLVLPVEDGGHRLELIPHGDGEVRLFGVAMDREAPGVILDAVGINGHRAAKQLQWHAGLQAEHLRRRRPDLVTLAYGTNESGDDHQPIEEYEAELRQVVGRVRAAVPEAACLLVGPSDRPLKAGRSWSERPRQADIVAVQKRVSAESGCAFFDLVAFMGGAMSMPKWVSWDPPYAARDHVHLTRRGYDLLGDMLARALLQGSGLTLDGDTP